MIARRLVDRGYRVAALEAGTKDVRPEIDSPFGDGALFANEIDWQFKTAPHLHANGSVLFQPRGKTLGGSNVFNSMLYIRGAQSDYHAWVLKGAAGSTWREVGPYTRRIENYDGPVSGSRGIDGPLQVHPNTDPAPLVRACVEAAGEAGHPLNGDYNDGDSLGGSFVQATTKGDHRGTAWKAYVGAIKTRRS